MAKIDDPEVLRRLYGPPGERSRRKQLDHLDAHCRRFVERSPFVVLATAGPDGLADATPRGDAPGFVAILDERTLALPDRPGNNRIDSLTNVVADPRVGLLFLVPGVEETLRVNGTAELRDDAELLARFAVRERLPKTVLVVHVREAYLHCAKALMRAKLWDASTFVDPTTFPSMGEMLKDQLDWPTAETREEMQARYEGTLY